MRMQFRSVYWLSYGIRALRKNSVGRYLIDPFPSLQYGDIPKKGDRGYRVCLHFGRVVKWGFILMLASLPFASLAYVTTAAFLISVGMAMCFGGMILCDIYALRQNLTSARDTWDN